MRYPSEALDRNVREKDPILTAIAEKLMDRYLIKLVQTCETLKNLVDIDRIPDDPAVLLDLLLWEAGLPTHYSLTSSTKKNLIKDVLNLTGKRYTSAGLARLIKILLPDSIIEVSNPKYFRGLSFRKPQVDFSPREWRETIGKEYGNLATYIVRHTDKFVELNIWTATSSLSSEYRRFIEQFIYHELPDLSSDTYYIINFFDLSTLSSTINKQVIVDNGKITGTGTTWNTVGSEKLDYIDFTYTNWSSTSSYAVGNTVNYHGVMFRCTSTVTYSGTPLNPPTIATANWETASRIILGSRAYKITGVTSNTVATIDGAVRGHIKSSTNATPIKIEVLGGHNLTTGDKVVISGHTTNTAANGTWTVTVLSAEEFTLNTSTGNGIGGQSGYFTLHFDSHKIINTLPAVSVDWQTWYESTNKQTF